MMSLNALIADLKAIPDWRRGQQPVDYPLWSLRLRLLSAMSGYTSLRGMNDFMDRHYRRVMAFFGVEAQFAPKYSTVRRMSQWVDGAAVTQRFERWANQEGELQNVRGMAFDGKA